MAIRYFKIILVVFVGLQGWLYLAGNIANWDSGLAVIAYVLGQEGHEYYATHIFPSLTNPVVHVLAFLIILTGEFLVGALSLKGALDLWKARGADAATFNDSKKSAIMGCAMAMVVWFGGFMVIGGALFQMWQTEIGDGSFDGSFAFAVTAGLILLFVDRPDS